MSPQQACSCSAGWSLSSRCTQLRGSSDYGSAYRFYSRRARLHCGAHAGFRRKRIRRGKRFPSDLAKSGAIKKLPDGSTYIDPGRFHELFAADLPVEQAAFMARSQVLNCADNFSATITTAAWRTKPSWMLVAGADKTISPDLERWYATRAKSHTVEIAGASHVVYITRPKQVAALIEDATLHAR